MVQSSYKNRKKNRKQSFKRKNTDGNRKVKFIEDDDDNKMVGGNKEEVAKLMTKYKDYPLSGLVLAAFSNARCAREDECEAMASDRSNLSSLQNSVYKCEDILKTLPDINGKPEIKSWERDKDSEFITYLDECIGYIIKNIFIPKDLIQNVYVQNDDSAGWTTLTNSNFNETQQHDLGKRASSLKPAVDDSKIYTAEVIKEIETLVATLGDTVNETQIIQLKGLVHKPEDMAGDDFENKVHNLTVEGFDADSFKEAFGTWSTEKLSEIRTAKKSSDSETESYSDDESPNKSAEQMPPIANEKKEGGQSAAAVSRI